MVYIKSLVCEGFKSFKKRTKINFSKGFTSIVGANGSGKSNILDAFVFALGELSGNKLRVSNIKDLICNGGTNGGIPSKKARVDVIFDNSDRKIPLDADTIKLSRKINEEGKGTYYLNDKRTTRRDLQDILDLAGLVPNSSNLIMQGELHRLINMNDKERRELIEDLAGIAFYNEKKEKAEKDLIKIEENISRITILLNELSIQLDSLEKERDDALKYQEHDNRQKKAQNALTLIRIKDIENQIENVKQKRDSLKLKIEEIRTEVIGKRENLMNITQELDIVKAEIKELQSNELRQLTLKLNDLKTEMAKNEASRDNHQTEINRLKKNMVKAFKKKDELESKKQTISNNLEKKKDDKESIDANLENLKEELYHSEEQIKELDSEYAKYQEELESIKEQLDAQNEIKSTINTELQVLSNKLENSFNARKKVQKKISTLASQIKQIKNKISEFELKEKNTNKKPEDSLNIDELEAKKRTFAAELKKLRKLIDNKYEEVVSIKSKLKAVKKYSSTRAVEAILNVKDKDEINGRIYGTIAQLGKSNQEYNTALQVAGGGKFNYLVVDNQQTAKQCIEYLKNNRIGRASFIPLDKIKVYSSNFQLPVDPNVIGRAVDLIEFNPMYARAFEFVFGRSVVVKNIETATTLKVNARKVTLEGDVVESSNLMTGGKKKHNNNGGFGLKEQTLLPKLETELNELRDREQHYSEKIHQIEDKISKNYKNRISSNNAINQIRQDLAVLRDNLKTKEEEKQELESTLKEYDKEINELEAKVGIKNVKMDKVNQDIQGINKSKEAIANKISMLKNNDFTKKVDQLRKEIDTLEKKRMTVKIDITKLETQLQEITTNQEREVNNNIESFQEELETHKKQFETIKSKITESTEEIKTLEKEVLEKNQKIGQIYNKKEELLKTQTEIKVAIEDLNSSIHPLNIKINTLDVNERNLLAQKEEIQGNNDIPEEKKEDLTEFLTFTQAKLASIIEESMRVKMDLEPVNMRAIKKYDKIKKRYDDLIEKHELVVDERISILNFIDKIETEKRETFYNTFEGINDNFRRIFSKLSPGGESKLVIENEEDPFAGGVKMMARPGGKKWCSTQSMSGGEKSLTIVALVLGIQMYVPSAYYILDEIDAAFDDHNASQVAGMIRELSEGSQFILITHRDVTMTKTDQLLGVSNVHGLTSVINLNISEALEQIAPFE